MRREWWIGVVTVALCMAFVAVGCGGSKSTKKSVSAGEYHGEDAYAALSRGDKVNYCSDLQTELDRTQAEFDSTTQAIQDTRDRIAVVRRTIVPIETEVRRLDSDVRTLNAQIAAVKALPGQWKVRPGDSLTAIAMMDQIYNDIDKWESIFSANLDKIIDPYYIFPDTLLVIPRNFPVN